MPEMKQFYFSPKTNAKTAMKRKSFLSNHSRYPLFMTRRANSG